jgi:hypothetical protein
MYPIMCFLFDKWHEFGTSTSKTPVYLTSLHLAEIKHIIVNNEETQKNNKDLTNRSSTARRDIIGEEDVEINYSGGSLKTQLGEGRRMDRS